MEQFTIVHAVPYIFFCHLLGQVTSDESIFHYDGAQNYSFYNPTNVSLPSFLEDLVVEKEGTQELADGVEICTVNGTSLDAPCLYDYLLTGRRDVAMSTSLASSSIAETRSMLGKMIVILR